MKVLILSRNYPNNEFPYLGLWVKHLVQHIAGMCKPRVVAPVPYCPPLPSLFEYTRFRHVASRENVDGVEVLHPRFLTGPGYSFHSFEGSLYYLSICNDIDRLRREFPFDLIHAHFTYPDGVVAARLGRRYRVPVIITEHALWSSWMDKYPRVRRQAIRASRECAFHIAVSRSGRDTIAQFTGESENLRVIPVGVDSSVFTPSSNGHRPKPNQILFVGFINFNKGIDILLKAMRQLVERIPGLRLALVGGSFYRDGKLQEAKLRHLAQELGLERCVEFVGHKPPHEVAKLMRESALLVLPSRRESFGVVLAEALACGIPVVATRCGGPEDIVNDRVGCLVPKENTDALASAIAYVLSQRDRYDSIKLNSYSLENFSWEHVARQTVHLYQEALQRFRIGAFTIRSKE